MVSQDSRIDRAALAIRADAILHHAHFADARALFCTDVPETYLTGPFRRTLIADTSCFAILISIIGLNRLDPVNGASVSLLVTALERGGFASETRIRAYINDLQHSGAIEIVAHKSDGRRRKLVPTVRLIDYQRAWFAANLRALAQVFALPFDADALGHSEGVVERYLTNVMLRHAVDHFTIFDDFPEAKSLMARRHGYILMLELAKDGGLDVDVGRNRLAQKFGVSTAHIATIVADAESEGWLQRNPQSSVVTLDRVFADRLNLWVARELALIAMWVESRFCTPQTAGIQKNSH